MINSQLYFKIAAVLYAFSLLASFLPGSLRKLYWPILMMSFGINGYAVIFRYYTAFPMLPMYLGPLALPFVLAALTLVIGYRINGDIKVARILLSMIVVVAFSAVLFPKDFYLPFIKSQTLLAHFFFLFGVVGRACFMVAAGWAITGLLYHKNIKLKNINTEKAKCKEEKISREEYSGQKGLSGDKLLQNEISDRHLPGSLFSQSSLLRSTRWTVWGFFFLTLSMFAGELWSYLGWGTPVVWDDPAITTTMATWFFYICWLHLHLTGSWTAKGRQGFAASGALVVFTLTLIPELGPFRWPF